MAALTLVASIGPVAVVAGPAAATDDGEDLSDLLLDEMPGYRLAPPGDPLTGGSGPIDWDEMGPDSGPAGGLWPEDMPSYVKSYYGSEDTTWIMLVGFDPKELPPSTMVAGFAASLEDVEGEPLTLPQADAAEIEYEAFVVAPADQSAAPPFSMAAFADDDIVVALYVDTLGGETADQRSTLDDFVTAQVAFEPPEDQATDDDRIGGDGPVASDEDAAPARPAGSSQQADGGSDGPSGQRIALAASWVLLMALLGVLAWYLGQGRQRRMAAAGWSPGPPLPPADRRPARSPAGPPLPPAASPPIAPWRRPLPPPPVAPPPIPYGGLRTQRRPAPVDAPVTPQPAPTPDAGGPEGESWRLPG